MPHDRPTSWATVYRSHTSSNKGPLMIRIGLWAGVYYTTDTIRSPPPPKKIVEVMIKAPTFLGGSCPGLVLDKVPDFCDFLLWGTQVSSPRKGYTLNHRDTYCRWFSNPIPFMHPKPQ